MHLTYAIIVPFYCIIMTFSFCFDFECHNFEFLSHNYDSLCHSDFPEHELFSSVSELFKGRMLCLTGSVRSASGAPGRRSRRSPWRTSPSCRVWLRAAWSRFRFQCGPSVRRGMSCAGWGSLQRTRLWATHT